MTHDQFGYYIHGESPLGDADISMQQMAQALFRESTGLTTSRGISKDSDHQTFSISVSKRLSGQYGRVKRTLYDVCLIYFFKLNSSFLLLNIEIKREN
jgi:hypothetical protein